MRDLKVLRVDFGLMRYTTNKTTAITVTSAPNGGYMSQITMSTSKSVMTTSIHLVKQNAI